MSRRTRDELAARAALAMPACTRCGAREPHFGWQQMCNGRRHLRVECGRCGGFLTWAPQVEPFVGLADQAASPTACLDVLIACDELGIELRNDGRLAGFAGPEDRRRAGPRLRDLVRQCSHDLARLMGRHSHAGQCCTEGLSFAKRPATLTDGVRVLGNRGGPRRRADLLLESPSMPIFIVRPKAGVRSRSVSLADRSVALRSRTEQTNEVQDLNVTDPAQKEITEWVEDRAGAREISEKTRDILGLHLVEMSAATAAKLGHEVPQADVIPDRPVDLIRPQKASESEGDSAHPLLHRWRDHWTAGLQGQTGKGVTVAVLDTGVEAAHPEFDQGLTIEGFTFDLTTGAATAQTPCVDTDTHGTHVAGLICGKSVGLAPQAKVLSGVMIPKGRGTLSSFLVAMSWAALRPDVSIVHLSAGLPGYVPEMRDAVDSLRACGILTVAAIGNDGRNLTRSPGNFAEVLSVGSFGFGGDRLRGSSFSSTGQMVVDNHSYIVPRVYAPGENIRSCVPGGSYDSYNGTSMAAPQISALAARVIERSPSITLLDLFADIDERNIRFVLAVGLSGYPIPFPFHHPILFR